MPTRRAVEVAVFEHEPRQVCSTGLSTSVARWPALPPAGDRSHRRRAHMWHPACPLGRSPPRLPSSPARRRFSAISRRPVNRLLLTRVDLTRRDLRHSPTERSPNRTHQTRAPQQRSPADPTPTPTVTDVFQRPPLRRAQRSATHLLHSRSDFVRRNRVPCEDSGALLAGSTL